jgi:hypothetical protein
VFIPEVSSARQMKVKNLVRHGKLRDEGCGCLLWFGWGGEFNQMWCFMYGNEIAYQGQTKAVKLNTRLKDNLIDSHL